jgi:RNA polymerase sigma-70 factor (ECF subfamily)
MDPGIVDWVTSNFLPFEAELRRMLRHVCSGPAEIDDVIQEVYYKVLTMESMAHVREPRAFLVTMAKNVVLMRMRRDAVVNIEAVANLEDLNIEDGAPSPERVAVARAELRWVLGLMANLPDRCKDVFRARRIEGLSQQETAANLNISEGIVEQETIRGMKLIQKMIASVGVNDEPSRDEAKKRKAGTRKQHAND